MVRIRLRRVGAPKQPSYRVVAADKEKPRDGRFLEILGHYNPRTEPSTIHFKEDRVYYWLGVGAQPSESVRKLFDQVGLWDRYQRFKDGEDVEALLAEAAEAEEARDVDVRTRRDDLVGEAKEIKEPVDQKEETEEPEEESEVDDETEEEAESEDQAESEDDEASEE